MDFRIWRVSLPFSVIVAAMCVVAKPTARAEESQTKPAVVQFFVSPQGNDAWSGRVATPSEKDGPLATVARAQQAVRELRKSQTIPVRVVLQGGTYFLDEPLSFGPSDSGTQAAPITYSAAAGEKVILSGGRRLTGGNWGEVNGQKAWVIDLPDVKQGRWNFRQLFVNGERRPRTRLPKQGEYRIEALADYDPKAPAYPHKFTQGTKRFVYAGSDIQPWRNLQDAEIVSITKWHDERLPIESVDVEHRTVTFDRKSLFALFAGGGGGRELPGTYWVENVFEALDTPGQWYVDRPQGRLYYLPRPGEDMQAAEIVAPRLAQVVRVAGREGASVNHVHFVGLTFSHNQWEPPADWAASLQASTDVPGAVYFDYAEWCSVRGGAVEHVGTYGVEVNMGCLEIEISHNRMTDLGAGGVRVGHFYDNEGGQQGRRRTASLPKGPASQRITVADNEITGGGRIFKGSVGVFVGENPGNKIIHNHIHNLPWGGISVGSLQTFGISPAIGNVVEYNHVHDLGRDGLSDIGGIYTNSIQPGTRIRYNVVHDVTHRDYGGWGIYTDEGSGEILIEKNLAYRCSSGPLFVSTDRNITVENNIFAFGDTYQIFRAGMGPWFQYTFNRNIVFYNQGQVVGYWNTRNRNFAYDRNLYWNASGKPLTFSGKSLDEWRAAGQDVHSVVADPLFVDPQHGNFRLRPGSPAATIGFEQWDLSNVGPRTRSAAAK